jgi:hypothetical protein
VCLERNKIELNEAEFDRITAALKTLLKSRPATIEELVTAAAPVPGEKVIRAIRYLVDTGKVRIEKEGGYKWV